VGTRSILAISCKCLEKGWIIKTKILPDALLPEAVLHEECLLVHSRRNCHEKVGVNCGTDCYIETRKAKGRK